MFNQFISKVREYLGGFRNQDEVEIARACFSRHLSPCQTANVIINNR